MTRMFSPTALLAVLVLASPVLADDIRGLVTRVDPTNNKIVVDGRGRGKRKGALTFVLGKDSQILFGKQSAELADVPAGRRVRVHYEMQDGQRVITTLRVNGSRPDRADDKAIIGTLRRISVKNGQMVVQVRAARGDKATEFQLNVPEKLKIMRAGKVVKLNDLKEGVRLRVAHEKRNGKSVATSVQVIETEQSRAIPKVRQALQLADFILKMFDNDR